MLPAVEQLLLELARRNVGLTAEGDRLRYSPRSALTAELIAQLKEHKAAVLAIVLRDDAVASSDHEGHVAPNEGATGEHRSTSNWDTAIEPPPPCPRCGTLCMWWNHQGKARCMDCDPATTCIKLQELATRMRRR